MQLSTLLLVAGALTGVIANDEDYKILGSAIFGRHGDREAKPAVYLTPLGATQQFNVGQFYRERYFGLDSSNAKVNDSLTTISGLNEEGYWIDGQIYGETAQSNILITSHIAFLQGLYPPTDIEDSEQMVQTTLAGLANGTLVDNPLDGYQYVKTNYQQNATDNYIWVKGDENCPALNSALKRVQNSDHFYKPGNDSFEFLQSLYDIDFIKETFTEDELVFSNSMNIFDEVFVNTIHNDTVAKQFSAGVIAQIKKWSDLYQWTISDKSIDPDLTIGAQSVIGKVLKQLNTTRTAGTPYLTYMTGSFNNMFQLSSILDLYTQSEKFKTMPSYACTYVFELLADDNNDTFVRFSFKNGTDDMGDGITSYPLFNSTETIIPWSDFEEGVKSVAISSVSNWCDTCGYSELSSEATLDMCVPYSDLYTAAKTLEAQGVDLNDVDTSKSDLSLAGAGGIGAGTTIGVFLILGGLFYLFRKFRNGKKSQPPILPVTATDEDTVEGASTIGKESHH